MLMLLPFFSPGQKLDFKVTSAGAKKSALGFARAMIPVDSAGAPRCAMISDACECLCVCVCVCGGGGGTAAAAIPSWTAADESSTAT
jgi:hypothetical protein